MKRSFGIIMVLLFLMVLSSFLHTKDPTVESKEYTMLSLGDSYTIGEGVAEADRFPNQVVLLLHNKGIYFEKPKIIATTGWTTDELIAAIKQENLLPRTFDFVTLLIGVNNQYRGRDLENYRQEFIELLETAIKYSGVKASHVIVLSIPDWGATSFAEGTDRKKTAEEIDGFNIVNKEESDKHRVHYIEITSLTRQYPDWIAADGLHPDAKQYGLWAQMISKVIEEELKK